MKTSEFSEPQIIKVLKEVEQGRSVPEVARELGVDKSTIYIGVRSTEVWKSHK
jgi:putative transposase